MIEPSRTDRDINFRRIPEQIRCFRHQLTASQILGHGIYAQLLIDFIGIRIRIRHQSRGAPFRGTSQSAFVAYPTHIIPHDGGNRVRLQTVNCFQDGIPVVYLLFSVRTFTVGSVKPYLVHLSIVGEQFGKLFYKEFIVGFSLPITFSITVPWRKINSEFQPILVTGLAKFPHHIPFAVLPWRRSNGMFGCPGRPQAETVVMLGGDDSHFKSALF